MRYKIWLPSTAYRKRLIPPHRSSWNKPLKVYQVCLSSFLVFGLLVVLFDLVVGIVNGLTPKPIALFTRFHNPVS